MADDEISMLTSLTGSTPEQATQYLTLAEGNLEQAAQLWFETGGSLASGSSTSAPPAVPTATRPNTTSYSEDSNGVIHIDSDVEDMNDEYARPQQNVEDDEAMARRLQQEMYGTAGGDPEGVRAPIARTQETLVGPGSAYYAGGGAGGDDDDVEAIIAQQLAARQARRAGGGARPGIFNQRDTQSAVWEDPTARVEGLARATGGASAQSSRAHSLAEMFRPPFEIITRADWEDAREQGKEQKKWLLVNVQDPAIFDCQVLNRDLWKDERVVAVIRESFLFLQYSNNDRRTNGYMQYYFAQSMDNPDAYPHIAIVDPRTGEQMKVWSGRPVPKVDDFVEALYNFLDRYSLDVAKKNPVAKRKPEKSKSVDVGRMTEEEMLEMAMQQSMANGGSGLAPKHEDPDDLTKSVDIGRAGETKVESSGSSTAQAEEDTESSSVESPQATLFAGIASDRPHEEPAADPKTTTRIQFRHPGGRVVRRFSHDDTVRRIYEWVKASPPSEEHAGKPFDLTFVGKNLIESLDATIEEAGLRNASITIEWTED